MVTALLVIGLPVGPPPSGYVQLKAAPVCPVAVKVKAFPEQIGFGDAAAVGALGVWFTITFTVPGVVEVQPFTVCVTLYTPVMAVVTLALVTGEPLAPPPSGYVQLNEAPLTPLAVSVNVLPEQIGFGDAPAVGAAGVGLTVTFTVPAVVEVQPFTVCVTV